MKYSIVLVTCRSLKEIFTWLHIMQRMKSAAEPTGALVLAVALSEEFNEKYPASVNKNVGVILFDGNLDLSVVPKMLELANQ